MKRVVITCLLFVISTAYSYGQAFNNEWIDYNKAYYKFNVGANGLFRISQSVLATAGLSSVPAEDFQLWRNGVEVPIYVSVPSGALGTNDFIEFYGVMNDGQADTRLYKYDSLQMNNKWSLYTDTAAYFLTVNPGGANQRIVAGVNDTVGNVLQPEPYFMHKLSKAYKMMMNPGYGYDLGELVNSASYETAEGWSSYDIGSGTKLYDNNSAIRLYSAGPPATLTAVVAGNAYTSRIDTIKINGTIVATTAVNGYNINRITATGIPLTVFTSDAANVEFGNTSSSATDQMIVASYEVTYPRAFNFGGMSVFNFDLAATDQGYYLEISNFNSGAVAPVLYDLTNKARYEGIVQSGLVKFVLPASASSRKMVLLSKDASKVFAIGSLQQRNFINYSDAVNQGDYIIISHPLLYDDGAGNNYVEQYRQYRSSADGGGYNAKIVDIDQLIDQFAFGVKHHPSSIRNFAAFALSNFSVAPKYFFLIGKGLNYNSFRTHESDPNVRKLALIPTFGYPSSDNLLTASRTGEYPQIPIGRLSAITGSEVGIYLTKMRQFEAAQHSSTQTITGKAWMKNVAEVTGGLEDPSLASLISSYMEGYSNICSDSLFGANVYKFSANTGSNKAEGTNVTMEGLMGKGATLITYFGHSSPNTIEFNLDNPESYNNTGKYPLIIINGCLSGDLFQFDTLRAVNKGSLSEKFVFADQKGSIGYIASTHYGLPTQLNYVNTEFYKNFSKKMYGETLGNILKATMKYVITTYATDYIAQTHVEEITLHGDPALRLNPHDKADYVIEDSLLTFSPSIVSVADDKVDIKAKILNIGKAASDSVKVKIELTTPNNKTVTIYSAKIGAILSSDSITVTYPINPLVNKGVNIVKVTIDPDNLVPELSEDNNVVTKSFTVLEDEIRPVYPYQYSIVNSSNLTLYGSTADATAGEKAYVMEMDTTQLFNSPSKIAKTVTSRGGLVAFIPDMPFTDSTVYYWRLAVGPVSEETRWLSSSFVYISGSDGGFSQSHYFQYKNNDFSSEYLDTLSRKFVFDSKTSKLLARVGTYPYYDWDQNNVNIDDIQIDYWGCVFNSMQFYVFDSTTLQPWKNYNVAANGRFGSWPVCNAPRCFFDFPVTQQEYRRRAMNFLDSIPNGSMVLIRSLMFTTISPNNSFVDTWKADTTAFGAGKSLWHKFQQLGLNKIDSFTQNYPFLFVFKKGDSVNYPIYQDIGPAVNSHIVNTYFMVGKETDGSVISPWFGPAKEWKKFKWDQTDPSPTATHSFSVIGRDISGNEVVLAQIFDSKDTSISFINAADYPYLKLRLNNSDLQNARPVQLKYWMLTGTPAPEGALAPTVAYQFQDTLTTTDTLRLRIAFRNISTTAFDSIKLRLIITDENGANHIYENLQTGAKLKPLAAGDTVLVMYDIPLKSYLGVNQLLLDINPDNDQPELFHFNNVLYKNLRVTLPYPCNNGNTQYYTGMTHLEGNSYQWQADSGSGFTDISDNVYYSGANSDTLSLINVPTSMYGTKYRCTITNGADIIYGSEFVLKFVTYWTGAVDSAWENPANWSCGILPDTNTDVFIPFGRPNYPNVNSQAVCRSLHLGSGSKITVTENNNITITGISLAE